MGALFHLCRPISANAAESHSGPPQFMRHPGAGVCNTSPQKQKGAQRTTPADLCLLGSPARKPGLKSLAPIQQAQNLGSDLGSGEGFAEVPQGWEPLCGLRPNGKPGKGKAQTTSFDGEGRPEGMKPARSLLRLRVCYRLILEVRAIVRRHDALVPALIEALPNTDEAVSVRLALCQLLLAVCQALPDVTSAAALAPRSLSAIANLLCASDDAGLATSHRESFSLSVSVPAPSSDACASLFALVILSCGENLSRSYLALPTHFPTPPSPSRRSPLVIISSQLYLINP